MARTPSTMVPLGSPLPSFTLPSTDGGTVSSADYAGRPLLVLFICNHCPFVKHLYDGLLALGRDYSDKPIGIVAINSNSSITHPDDSFEKMIEEKARLGYRFPYLHDESQAVAKAFHAACTPDFFLYDHQGRLAYRGQFDDSRPGNGVAVTGSDLRAAMDALLAGNAPVMPQKASLGCNIKWHPEG
jgi:thiol-disulfide isomerase/thioredoxin